MDKTNITLATLGHMPDNFINRNKIKEWESSLFKINGDIESYSLTKDSDGANWDFTDKSLEKLLPSKFGGDFMIGPPYQRKPSCF